MLKAEFIQKLKRNNISQDVNKTMERVRKIWKFLGNEPRNEILLLGGIKKPTIARVYKTGIISARVATAIAQVTKTDPLYLIGASDEQRPFADEHLIDFLTNLGYRVGKSNIVKQEKILDEAEQQDEMPPVIKADITPKEAHTPRPRKINAELSELSEDNCMHLLKNLFIQSAYTDEKAKRLERIKFLLVI